MNLKKALTEEIRDKLLREIEEEDIGISLFSTFYQDENDLRFFKAEDRERVLKILKKLSEDSRRHKTMLLKIISRFEEKCHGNRNS